MQSGAAMDGRKITLKASADRWLKEYADPNLQPGTVRKYREELDIDLESKVIHIRRSVTHPTRSKPEVKDTKTPASVRDIALSSIAAEFLVPGKPNDFVIGGENPLSYTMLRHMRQRIQKDIGFHGDITPARFRPTVLRNL